MQSNIWLVAAVWMGLALVASVISIRVGISVALIEIIVGIIAGNFFDLQIARFVLPERVYFDPLVGVRTTKLGLIFAMPSGTTNPCSLEVDLRFDSTNFCTEYFIELVQAHKEMQAAAVSTSRAA